MRVLPTVGGTDGKQTSFKGFIQHCNEESSIYCSPFWHGNSSIEATGIPKSSKAYYAEPLEPVSQIIKDSVDYIIYDNEPSYPDVNKEVSKNFFSNEYTDYHSQFDEIREYYYRREMGGYADIADAKYQQWQAAECVKLYDKSHDLRDQKRHLENECIKFEQYKAELNAEKSWTLNSLKEAMETKSDFSRSMDILVRRSEALTNMQKLDTLDGNTTAVQESKEKINVINKLINELNESINSSKKAIQERKQALKDICDEIRSTNKEIASTNVKIDEIKAKLIPLFDELKNFYAKQGIKVIKNL
jgi:hypothetical protein